MKVILCEDVDNLGEMGETVNVAPGYARNYLLPRRLAVSADSASARQIEHEMRIIKKREERRRKELAEVAQGIDGTKIVFKAKAGSEGKLFGSVTTLHIAQKLEELGHNINRRKIDLSEPIKSLGEHEVTLRLKSGIEAKINVVVEAEEIVEAPPEEKAAEAEVETVETEQPAEAGAEESGEQPSAEEPKSAGVPSEAETAG